MYRTQILLEKWQHQSLKLIAIKNKKSLSQIIREWITEKLDEQNRFKKDPLLEAAGTLKKHIKKRVNSSKIDEIIYKKDW